MRSSVLTMIVSLAAACSSGSSSSTARAVPADEAAEVLIDRNWLDVWPQSKDERLHVYRFTPAMGGGVFQDRTLFKGTFELFRFEVEGTTLEFELPETEQRVRTSFRIDRVEGPKPFDLRLTLEESPRGPTVYYGRSAETGADWIGPVGQP
ncbi:MAG TPA: hypothetical protein VML75_07605 [Kofleriaceae bacterium]|nr:hypothetical protein [Kofleriaceae bacterium]